MNRKGKKCVIYIRVSTEMQVDGFSLDGQRNILKRYAEREGMIVKDIYEDAGKSGKSIEGRPAFTKMLKDIGDGLSIDYILVYKLSRFGRNAADILNSIEYIQSYDINLIATEEGIDSSQTSGKLLISVLSAVSEIERENIIEQTMNGRKEKARQGGWNGGFAPYGYKLENGKLFIAEDEADIIKMIFELYVYEDIGTYNIATRLNYQGIKKKLRQNNTLDYWSQNTVRRILDNPVYVGKVAFGRRKKTKVKGTKNQYQILESKDFILGDGQHEAIISEELWNLAYAKRQAGKKKQPHNSFDHVHLLSSILRCPSCGGPMHIRYQGSRYVNGVSTRYYEYGCVYTRTDKGHICNYHGRIKDYEIEPYIISLIKDLVYNDEFANNLKEKIGTQVDTTKMEKELSNYQKKLFQVFQNKSDLEISIDSLPLDVKYRDKALADMNKRLYGMYDMIEEIEERIEDLKQKILGVKNKDITIEKIQNALKNFDKLFSQMSGDEKRRMMSLIIDTILFHEDGRLKEINFKFPVSKNKEGFADVVFDKENVQSFNISFNINDENVFIKQHTYTYIPRGKDKPIVKKERPTKYSRKTATYKEIKAYILEKYGLKIHTTYIAEMKRFYGIDMQCVRHTEETMNRSPHPTEAKKKAIIDAFQHFNLITQDQITE